MKSSNPLILSTSPTTLPTRKPRLTARPLYRSTRRRYTGKEQDSETGLHYYGARYLDSRTGRWLSGDPAVGDYVPQAPVNDEAKKRNGSLPGQGGVFNYVNLHVYHYAGNNPVKYTDPNGEIIRKISDAIRQQDSTAKLGSGDDTINKSGCVLTTFLRIANAISPTEFTLEEANKRAMDLDLYTNKDELSYEAGAKLISSLTGKNIKSGMVEGTETDLMKTVKNMDENPYEGFFVTGRIEARSSDGKSSYGHQVNINEKGNNGVQPIVDTSNKDRKTTEGGTNGKEPLYRMYWFKTERE